MSLLFHLDGQRTFPVKRGILEKLGFENLKCGQFSLIYGRFKEMMLLTVETVRNKQ